MDELKTKICSKCKKEKQFTYFSKNIRKKDCHSDWCKECCKEYANNYKRDNKEYQAEYRKKNADLIKKRNKDYYSKNKEKLLKKDKIYRETHDREIKKRREQYRIKNKDKIKEANRINYLRRKERALNDHEYAEHLKDINRRSVTKWQSKNKEYLAEYKRRIGNTVKGKAMKLEADRKYREKLKRENPKEYSEKMRKHSEMKRVGLRDVYVVSLIKKSTGLSTEQIREYPELIESKRQTIKIKRLCRT